MSSNLAGRTTLTIRDTMSILRLLILLLLGLFFRRLYLAVRKVLRGGGPPTAGGPTGGGQGPGGSSRGPSHRKIREEDISDADFEEIP